MNILCLYFGTIYYLFIHNFWVFTNTCNKTGYITGWSDLWIVPPFYTQLYKVNRMYINYIRQYTSFVFKLPNFIWFNQYIDWHFVTVGRGWGIYFNIDWFHLCNLAVWYIRNNHIKLPWWWWSQKQLQHVDKM